MNDQFQRGTVGGSGFQRRGVTGATYSRESLRQQMAEAQERGTAQPTQSGTAQPQPKAHPTKPVRVNKYAAPCANCGVRVEAEQGRLENKNGKWQVSHIPPCPAKDEAPQAQPQQADTERNVVNGQTLFDGTYTFQKDDGAHRTFKVRTQPEDAEFKPGQQLISYLTGPDNTSDYKRFGHIFNGRLYIWKRFADHSALVRDAEAFMANPHEALASATCFACGRTLTVPTSIHAGYGPECARRRA